MKIRVFHALFFTQLMVGPVELYAQSGVAWVQHAPTVHGSVEGGMQQMMGEPLMLGGGAWVSGDYFLPGSPIFKLNGSPTLGEVVAGEGGAGLTNYTVTLSGNAHVGRMITRTDPSSLPVVGLSGPPAGVRSVVLNKSTERAGDFSALLNLTLNGDLGQLAIPAGAYGDFAANGACGFTLGVAGAVQPAVYSFRRLSLTGQAQVRVAGPVIITLSDSLVLQNVMGSAAMPSWLTLMFSSGDLTLAGNAVLHGYVINPSGTVTLNGRSQLRGGLVADRLAIGGGARLSLIVPRMVPYFTGFEPSDGYSVGSLAGQAAWTASIGATITDTLSYRGAQSILLTPSTPPTEATQPFGAYVGQPVVFVDVFAKPVAGRDGGSSVFVQADVAQVALVRVESQGELHIRDGGGGWRSVGAKVSLAAEGQALDWLRVTIREDFSTKRWDLYVDGKLIAYDAEFTDGTKTIFTRITFLGSTTAASVFDDFYVGFENPLFADANNDGIDDAWETFYGLSLAANNRNRVLAGSTVSVIQAYLNGIDPRGSGAGEVKPDTDFNGLPDGWEIQYFGQIGVDPNADPNGNGLTNMQDYQLGLNPVKMPPPNAAALVHLRVFAP